MAQSTRLPRARRRAQLLEVATRRFSGEGYFGTSMDSIARDAGVTKPVLYQHFPSKEELYVEVVRSVGDTVVHKLEGAGDVSIDTRERVTDAVERLAGILLYQGRSMRLLDSGDHISDAVAVEVDRVLRRAADVLARVLMQTRAIDAEVAAILGWSLTALARATAEQFDSDDSRERYLTITDTLTTLVTSGLDGFTPHEGTRTTAPAPATAVGSQPSADTAVDD